MYLSAVIPSMLFSNVPYPTAPIPYAYFLSANANFFLDCLPILALQCLISLQFKNFLAPVGSGFALWFLGVGMKVISLVRLYNWRRGRGQPTFLSNSIVKILTKVKNFGINVLENFYEIRFQYNQYYYRPGLCRSKELKPKVNLCFHGRVPS